MPVEETTYGRACFRLELRPLPSTVESTYADMEACLAKSGVKARWISVVDPWGSPVYPSRIIPSPYNDSEHQEGILHKWVSAIHSQGSAVISWYPLIFSEAGWKTHSEWRQVSLLPWPQGKSQEISCCVNSSYGDAVIELMCEAISKFKLNGIWFDGSAFTEIWERPLPLTCFCDSCREKFKQDTGLDLPDKLDWDDPVFRRWVAWRYEVFGSYIGRLAREIRKRHPDVAIVVNHYHRPQIPWHSAIPLDIYDADIITGSEATGIDSVDLVMRLCRAYNRKQSEVWRPLDIGGNPPEAFQTNDLLHHALACYIAGGFPSFGYPGGDINKAYETISLISPIMSSIHPYVGGKSLPYLAIHISQQSETFYFGRAIDGKNWKLEPFFALLSRWTKELMNHHIAPDYIYDKALTKENLSRYKVLLMPFSPSLSQVQAESILYFIKEGGTVYIGPGCGEVDEWGEHRKSNPLGAKLGFQFTSIYPPSASELTPLTLYAPSGDSFSFITSLYTPLRIQGKDWKVLYRLKETNAPALALRKYGKGFVIISALDIYALYPWQAVEGVDTKILPSTQSPAQGEICAKFIDSERAPYPFCPDMEITNFPSLSFPAYRGGQFSFYIKLENIPAQVELRNSQTGETGILLYFASDGHLTVNGREITVLPLSNWVKVTVFFRLSRETEPGEFGINLSLPNEEREWRAMPLSRSWTNFDWAVIFGPATKGGCFWIDDVEIWGLKPGNEAVLVFKEDFEDYGREERTLNLVDLLIEQIKKLSPSPVLLEEKGNIRLGAFEKEGTILLHLHNPAGSWKDFKKTNGKVIKLSFNFPISKASLLLKENQQLRVKKQRDTWEISLPCPSLYEIIRIWR